MQRKATISAAEIEYERIRRAQYAKLTAHYGKIGSAALNAALIHARCRREKQQEHLARNWNKASR